MGASAVEYHEENVLERGDDHPGRALDYYGSRGETPLRWEGDGAARLGLGGDVTPQAYRAAFAEGGFTDPVTGRQLVSVKRPGFELVIDAHKSVAVLGVIGQPDDMHAILDAESGATMAFLDGLVRERGGRRGREGRRAPTGGLTYAVTRHGTSRAGDPQPHDHVLVPNIVEMRDAKGGWKALDSSALRDWVEPATMVGRLHGAAKAVELGYAIEPDDGGSGRKRSWRIAGIPAEVCELYSKRSSEIDDYIDALGQDTPQARNIAARATRAAKRHTGVDELMPRWRAELEALGWNVNELREALDRARSLGTGFARPLTGPEVDGMARELFDPEGDFLRRSKVFTRSRLVAEVAPRLYGHRPDELGAVVDRILASGEVVPLVAVAGAREQAYATATVLATEQHIAEAVERLASAPFPAAGPEAVAAAVTAKQEADGYQLTAGQRRAVEAVAGSGRRVDVIVGVAGSGKTTALDAASSALEHAGFQVIGTSTSSGAARTLAEEAGVEADTLRMLTLRLARGDLTLNHHSVVVLDEAAMTADVDLARLVAGVERAGAKLVLVGDHRQLAAIGPGGAFEAVLDRHPEVVVTMTDNVRQHDRSERQALAELRAGDVTAAVDWYARRNRTVIAPDRLGALAGMVEAWAADIDAGHDAAMYAFRRRNVADLNRLARHNRRQAGHLTGPDMTAPGGRPYAVGDRVVLTARNHRKGLVNAQAATVAAIHPERTALTIRTDDDRTVTLAGEEVDADRLAHGYALTVHRAQGATTGRAHVLADGGGRQLGYVAMSRAKDHSTIHAIADDHAQALDDLQSDWGTDRRQLWLTDTTRPGTDPRPLPVDPAAHARRLRAELAELDALVPPDTGPAFHAASAEARRLRAERDALRHGSGTMPDTPAGRAAARHHDAHRRRVHAQQWASHPHSSWRVRRQAARDLRTLTNAEALTRDDWHTTVEPALHHLDHRVAQADAAAREAADGIEGRQQWLRDNPAHTRRRRRIETELDGLEHPAADERAAYVRPDQEPTSGRAEVPAQDALDDALRRLEGLNRQLDSRRRPEPPIYDIGPEPPAPDTGLGL